MIHSPTTAEPDRRAPHGAGDLALRPRELDRLRDLVYRHTGILLGGQKRDLVYNRVSRRLRALSLTSFSDYCDRVEAEEGSELEELINAITTNVTAFFREPHHFELLTRELLPAIAAERRGERRLRAWCAGCSSGEEPYSLAMTIAESGLFERGWDVKILATDIDTEILGRAASGVYPRERMEGVSPERERRWFLRGTGGNEGLRRVRPELRERITFRQLNLVGPRWPMSGPFDFVFCRNVAIYFDRPTQELLFQRYWELLDPSHGHLFVGHSESLANQQDLFRSCGNTVYRKSC